MAERVMDKYQFKIIKQEIRAISMNVLLAHFLSKMGGNFAPKKLATRKSMFKVNSKINCGDCVQI